MFLENNRLYVDQQDIFHLSKPICVCNMTHERRNYLTNRNNRIGAEKRPTKPCFMLGRTHAAAGDN